MFFRKKSQPEIGKSLNREMPSFVFRWRNAAKRHAVDWLALIGGARAKVKDFSSSGMYIELEEQAEVGSPVEFVVAVEQDGKTFHMVCSGEIARMVHQDGRTGVGVKFTKPVQLKTATPAEAIDGAALWRRV